MQARALSAVLVATALGFALLATAPAPGTARVLRDASDGERFLFGAWWNGIPVANAHLVIAPDPDAPESAVHLSGRARTNAFLDLFWRMRNSFDAVVPVDPATAPGTFYLEQNENTRRRETWIKRDTTDARLIGRMERPGKKTRHGEADLHASLHDPASVSYLIKHLPADLTETRTYEVFEGYKVYRITVTPVGEEDISVMGRQWQARKLDLGLELVPRTERQRRKNKQPKIQHAELWVSTDDERVLLKMVAGTWWGRVTIAATGRDKVHPASRAESLATIGNLSIPVRVRESQPEGRQFAPGSARTPAS